MTDGEAAEVLSDEGDPFISYSCGWPAVLALAAIAKIGPPPESDRLPSDLHDFFAEDSSRRSVIRTALICVDLRCSRICRTSSPGSLGDTAEEVLAVGVNSGFLVARGRAVPELHPLLRGFLREKLALQDDKVRNVAISDALCVLLEADRWEDAFDLALRFDRLSVAFLEDLLSRSL